MGIVLISNSLCPAPTLRTRPAIRRGCGATDMAFDGDPTWSSRSIRRCLPSQVAALGIQITIERTAINAGGFPSTWSGRQHTGSKRRPILRRYLLLRFGSGTAFVGG
jgi:hypothetical protein